MVPSQLCSLWNLIISSNGNSHITSELSTKNGSLSTKRWSRANASGPAITQKVINNSASCYRQTNSHLFLRVRFPVKSKFECSTVSLRLPFLVEAYPINSLQPKSHVSLRPVGKKVQFIRLHRCTSILELKLQSDAEPLVYYKIRLMVSVLWASTDVIVFHSRRREWVPSWSNNEMFSFT